MTTKAQLRASTWCLPCLLFLTFGWVSRCEAQQSETDVAIKLLRRMDRNRDGILDSAEIPRNSRPGVAKIARRAGVDPTKPIPIDSLRKQLKRDSKEQQEAQQAAADASSAAASSSRGFGRSNSKAADAPVSETSAKSDSTAKSDNTAKKTDDKRRERDAAKIRSYARSLLKQFDKNKNGVLEKEEWSKMRGNPEESDANQDGKLTVDELVVRLSNYTKAAPPKNVASPSAQPQNRVSRRKTDAEKKRSYRFLTPTERLSESMPRKLRESFLTADKDGDGQIAMDEFASFWSKRKAAEFAELDGNNDGVITPTEYIIAKSASE